eukprot:22044-Pelagomonas_calceolata.AAC.2
MSAGKGEQQTPLQTWQEARLLVLGSSFTTDASSPTLDLGTTQDKRSWDQNFFFFCVRYLQTMPATRNSRGMAAVQHLAWKTVPQPQGLPLCPTADLLLIPEHTEHTSAH